MGRVEPLTLGLGPEELGAAAQPVRFGEAGGPGCPGGRDGGGAPAVVISTWAQGLPTYQTVRRFRPRARRRFKTRRPPRVLMRSKKPWVRARRKLWG